MRPPAAAEVIADLKARLRALLARTPARAGPGASPCRGQLVATADRLLNAISDSPDGEALCLVGDAFYERGDLAQAIWWYDTAVWRDPCTVDGYLGLARVYRQQGRPTQALPLLEQALGIDPDHAETHLQLGTILGERGELGAAAAELQRCLQAAPGHALAWHNLAVTVHRQGWIDLAATAYLSAVQLDPENLDAQRTLDVLYGQSPADQPPAGYLPVISQPDAAVRLKAHFERWSEYIDNGRIEDANRECGAIHRIDPKGPEARVARPTTGMRLGNQRWDDRLADKLRHCTPAAREMLTDFLGRWRGGGREVRWGDYRRIRLAVRRPGREQGRRSEWLVTIATPKGRRPPVIYVAGARLGDNPQRAALAAVPGLRWRGDLARLVVDDRVGPEHLEALVAALHAPGGDRR